MKITPETITLTPKEAEKYIEDLHRRVYLWQFYFVALLFIQIFFSYIHLFL